MIKQQTESWGTRVGLVLAMAGNAVGLGNFLRFPVQAIQNGGGAFIIPYLVCFLLMGIPLLMIEWTIGRYGGEKGNHSAPFMMDRMGKKRYWKYIGVFGIFSNIGIAAYYCFIESWTLAYVFHSAIGSFTGMTQEQVVEMFSNYVNLDKATLIPFEGLVFFIICLAINVYILSKGLSGGIEKVAKIGVPMLIFFGIFLAIKSVTLTAGSDGARFDGIMGLNFLWTPTFDSISNPKVWLNAAGQVFFTLSVGMGSIQCYASYVKKKDDIALNSMSAGWMNEFVEVVIGGAIIIPLAVGYFGVEGVKQLAELGGLSIGFKTLPFLFDQWGPILAAIAGIFWFGLLFFAGITSSLAMGMPVMSFLEDEFNWSRKKSALTFGIIILALGLPTVFFYNFGVFDEYDYWTGTFSLFLFAMLETILFSWVFKAENGWREYNYGADFKVPSIYKYILKYVTPILLIIVFIGATIKPVNNDWDKAFNNLVNGNGWSLDNSSVIKQALNIGLREQLEQTTDPALKEQLEKRILYTDAAKILLLLTFIGIAFMVKLASNKRKKEGRTET